ncbi:FecR domain-containing protein [Candidatus Microgenomates bacterium]|nr:FecR domain-containing protein [Candidatus Microgenomates bacterium]
MKKLILPILLIIFASLFLLSSKTNAQENPDCRKIFDKESYKCLGVSGDCQRKCGEETKRPDGGAYFNSGEVYSKCTKANDCDGKGQACNEQALANFRTCSGTKSENKENSQAEKQPGLPVFIGEWLSKFSQIVYEDQLDLAPDLPALEEVFQNFGAPPTLKDRFTSISFEEGKTKDDQMSFIDSLDPSNVRINKGGQYVTLNPEEEIPDGSTISVGKQALFRAGDHFFEVKPLPGHREAVFHIRKNKTENRVDIEPFFQSGEVEVFKPKATDDSWQVFMPFNMETPEAEVSSKQTYYSVSRNQDKKATLVKVYEGEVEVKTKDGKTTTITPNGDKPGVVVISQKLSPVKLVVVGLVLVAIIGGAIFLLKKRGGKKLIKRARG